MSTVKVVFCRIFDFLVYRSIYLRCLRYGDADYGYRSTEEKPQEINILRDYNYSRQAVLPIIKFIAII
jgi:hypothetical protein